MVAPTPSTRAIDRLISGAPVTESADTAVPVALTEIPLHQAATVVHVGGERAFRRRLLELGFVPGTTVVLRNIAPMGDPLELEVRGCRISIRRAEAGRISVDR